MNSKTEKMMKAPKLVKVSDVPANSASAEKAEKAYRRGYVHGVVAASGMQVSEETIEQLMRWRTSACDVQSQPPVLAKAKAVRK